MRQIFPDCEKEFPKSLRCPKLEWATPKSNGSPFTIDVSGMGWPLPATKTDYIAFLKGLDKVTLCSHIMSLTFLLSRGGVYAPPS